MSRRVLKSLVPLVGAAALIAAPFALAAPASAAPIAAAIIAPDETMPFDPDANHEEFWEDFLWEEEGIDALCVKEEPIEKPYTIPEIDELFEADEGVELEYVLAVLKGGADQDSEKDANELYFWPMAGDQLSHTWYGNSHVILCVTEVEEETTPPVTTKPPTTKPPVTGPVVETDRVADGGSAAGLGLAAMAAALVAGAGAMFVSRRRQGAHR